MYLYQLETLFFNEIDQQLEDELVENQSSRCFTGGVVGQQEIEEKRVRNYGLSFCLFCNNLRLICD